MYKRQGLGLDKDAFRSLADSLYLNSRLDLELPTSKSSFDLDSTTADALVMQTSIGQGDTLVTPMEMALIASAVANDGEMIKPRYVDNIVSADGQAVKTFYKESLGTVMSESEANTLTELMKGVVQSGTAVSLSDLPYNIAGKTGTAEHGSDGETPHSWFVGFSNADDPDIVIAVVDVYKRQTALRAEEWQRNLPGTTWGWRHRVRSKSKSPESFIFRCV